MDSSSTGGAPATHWIHTPPIREPRRLAAFQQMFTEHLGVHVEPLHGQPLVMRGSVTEFDGLGIYVGESTPTRCIHPRPYSSGGDTVTLTSFVRGQWR